MVDSTVYYENNQCLRCEQGPFPNIGCRSSRARCGARNDTSLSESAVASHGQHSEKRGWLHSL